MDTSFLAEIHPKVVHFPVALLSTYAVLEIIGIIFKKEFITKTAFLLLCLGVFFSLLAVLTGNEAASNFKFWNESSKPLLNLHESYATYLLWSSVLICVIKFLIKVKKKSEGSLRFIFIPLALLLLFLIYETGTHGADLVKKFGVGTELLKDQNEE